MGPQTEMQARSAARPAQVFVGTEDCLQLLVQFLCAEMQAAFRSLGAVLPPWRQASSMCSKWRAAAAGQQAGGAAPASCAFGARVSLANDSGSVISARHDHSAPQRVLGFPVI